MDETGRVHRAVRRFSELAAGVLAQPGPVRLVGVDGCGGAGKTTFADRLALALDGAPVVHTDDFASHDEPIQWWPRMLTQVVEPLRHGEEARFRPYDWVARRRAEAEIVVAPAPVVVIEGGGATRAAWRPLLAARVWVETPRAERLRRGIERDGEALREFWLQWMAAEDDYVRAESPRTHADLVVDGDPPTGLEPDTPFDPDTQFVAIDP